MNLLDDFAGSDAQRFLRPWRVGVGLLICCCAPLLGMMHWAGMVAA